MATSGLLVLAFTIWWFFRKGISRQDRLFGFGVTLAGGIAAAILVDKSVGPFGLLMFALPCVFTTATIWLLLAKRFSVPRPRVGLTLVVLLTWGYSTLIRTDGISGEQRANNHWRWTPTAEELYLAQKKSAQSASVTAVSTATVSTGADTSLYEPLVLQPGDWPGFRGPERDGVVRGIEISTDWSAAPPRQIWKQRVGPAWSSVCIVGDRLFTQEQRGKFEAVVCLDANSGREIWAHQDSARFWESVAGAGPRATPTFDSGRIYAQGATGIVNCLDAATGKRYWTRNIADEAHAKLPGWGLSASPLVVQGVVLAYAAGAADQGLLAFRADTGEPAWGVATGQNSYSSPVLTSLGGKEQVLFLSDSGLVSLEPASGRVLWQYGSPTPGAPISIQPHPLNDSQVLLSSPGEFGLALIDLTRRDESCVAEKRWASRALHPSFNDLVIYRGTAFGFDEAIFGCLDVETGKRLWKKGRYGHGQVVLLQDQGLLLVAAESGEVVLLAANADKLEELGRFQAIEGKTWNHPAIAHGRLYVRNAEEMACYELATP
jgi:outer membrane protein assembly factor BamB